MFAKAIFALAAIASASALMITHPSNSSGWDTKGSQLIKWTSVSTDPSNFTITVLTSQDPSSAKPIAQTVKTSDNSYIWTPSSDLTAGVTYRVNLVNPQGGILAQSELFAVVEGQSSVTPTATSSSASSTGSTSQTDTSSSSATSSVATSTTSQGAASPLNAPGIGGLLLLAAGAIGALACN